MKRAPTHLLLLLTDNNKEYPCRERNKETLMPFSDHDRSLLMGQPRKLALWVEAHCKALLSLEHPKAHAA